MVKFLILEIKAPFKRYHVKLGRCVGDDDEIWTFAMNTDSKNVPIVLLHGFGAGSAFWAMNLEELAVDHPVYAFDTLGFARSSRPEFSDDPDKIEDQFVESIERWREAVGIDRMVLLGHSFGGFKASSYALKYPDRLEHLILVDPWGYDEAPDLQDFPLWKLSFAYSVRLMVRKKLKLFKFYLFDF
jgi:abhydrolase domain-containing protein 4